VLSVLGTKKTTNNLLEDKFSFSSTTTSNRTATKMITEAMEIRTEMAAAGIRVTTQLTWTTCLSRRGTSTPTVTSKDWASTIVIRTPETTRAEEIGIGTTETVKTKEDIDDANAPRTPSTPDEFIIKLMKQ